MLCFSICLSGKPAVRLSPLFSDGVVLQQKSEVPVFGFSDSSDEVFVTVSWSGRTYTACPDSSGRFVVNVKTPKAGGPYSISLNGETAVKDVMLGEVWVCSGQSNMQFELSASDMTEVEGENNPNVRIFTVPIRSAATPQKDIEGGKWHYGPVSDIKNQVSAVAYYFASNLQKKLGVSVGILSTARGATAAEEWINPEVFASMNETVRNTYVPPKGRFPGCWYNAMVAPLLPYKISGFIWYQGENNASRPWTYSDLMKGLIDGWRRDFRDSNLPFYIVELAPFANNWAEFREVQQSIADNVGNSGFVSILDSGDPTNIHPKNKYPVGKRLADMAASNVYHKKSRNAPPRFMKAKSDDGFLRVYFSNPGDSLVLKHGDAPLYFEIAGEDGCFSPAKARVEGKTVVLWSGDIPEPVYARYFFGKYNNPNLFSSDGYPVAPFRMKVEHPAEETRSELQSLSYESSVMPGASDTGWKPLGINSATASVSLADNGLNISTESGTYGYQVAMKSRESESVSLAFEAAVDKGVLNVDYNNGNSARLYVEISPDSITDGVTGDTLATSLDNSRMSSYMLNNVNDTVRLYKDGVLLKEYMSSPDNSYYDDFDGPGINDKVFRCSSWSRYTLVGGAPGKDTGLLEWRNGTTGLFAAELKVKPNTSYRLEFDAMVSDLSAYKEMKGRFYSDKRDISPVLIKGRDQKSYVLEFKTYPEEYTVNLMLHNGYYEKQGTVLLLDKVDLTEVSSEPYLQFGCFNGAPSDVTVKSIDLE